MNIEFLYSKNEDRLIEIVNINGDESVSISGFERLVPNTVDAAKEKHVPVIRLEDDNILYIQVGEVLHPMTSDHLISKLYIVTDKGDLIKKVLTDTDKPELTVDIKDAKKVDVYAYCNLHGLWKTSIEI